MDSFVTLAYLLSASLFIFGLKGLSHPRTAVRGNMLGALGMLIAVVVTLLDKKILDYSTVLVGLILGAGVGSLLALRVQMTAMPQLVAVFNGLGGGASALVAGSALHEAANPDSVFAATSALSGLIGAVTFFGSGVAFAKLQGLLKEKPIRYQREQTVKALFFGAALLFTYLLASSPSSTYLYWLIIAVSAVLGVLLTIAIGGADMPVVIALLNSYSGLAAAATGFVLENTALIISGSLVGASGIILKRTAGCCRAGLRYGGCSGTVRC